MTLRRHRMGSRHERFLTERLGGRATRGSGNQWHEAADGRHNRMTEPFAFAWDGKSTLNASISVTLAMWRKIVEQAGGERPMLALRWYANERLDTVTEDLVVLSLEDFLELREAALKGGGA